MLEKQRLLQYLCRREITWRIRIFSLPFGVMATTKEIRSYHHHIFYTRVHNMAIIIIIQYLWGYKNMSSTGIVSFCFQFPLWRLGSQCWTLLHPSSFPFAPFNGRVVKMPRTSGGGRCSPPKWRSVVVTKPKSLDGVYVWQSYFIHTHA
jgi:hypothetical protein